MGWDPGSWGVRPSAGTRMARKLHHRAVAVLCPLAQPSPPAPLRMEPLAHTCTMSQ